MNFDDVVEYINQIIAVQVNMDLQSTKDLLKKYEKEISSKMKGEDAVGKIGGKGGTPYLKAAVETIKEKLNESS